MDRLAGFFGKEQNTILQIDRWLAMFVVRMARHKAEFAIDADGSDAVRKRRMFLAMHAVGITSRYYRIPYYSNIVIVMENTGLIETVSARKQA